MKIDQELTSALKNHVTIQIDSLDELRLIIHLTCQLAIKPRLSLRLATRYGEKGFSRFGLLAEDYWEAMLVAQKTV